MQSYCIYISGIAAAKIVHESGIRDILVLEATSRIGGRLMKTKFSGYNVEMRANWLFGGGPMSNTILDTANKTEAQNLPQRLPKCHF